MPPPVEADARHLARIEERKQALSPDDPEGSFVLSEAIERLTGVRLRHQAAAEAEIAEEIPATA